MAKNYYLILGVAPDAESKQIKAAYRRRVKTLHPDYHGSDARPFLDLQEAYSALSDPGRRRRYDASLQAMRPRIRRHRTEVEPLIPEESRTEPRASQTRPATLGGTSLSRSFHTYSPSFDELFDYLWSNFVSVERPKAERVRSLGVEVVLSLHDAARGGQARIAVPARARCPTCGGSGGVGFYDCWRCAGEGAISGEVPFSLSVPPGVPDGYTVEVALDRLGIRNCHLTVTFRVGSSG